MPGWAGSSWYFNRYMDSNNEGEFASKEALNYWKEVDLYIGGSEHATGHLLYARFWQKFLFDKGIVPVDEFAKKLINQGMILGTSAFYYKIDGGFYQYEEKIEEIEFVKRESVFENIFKLTFEGKIISWDLLKGKKIRDAIGGEIYKLTDVFKETEVSEYFEDSSFELDKITFIVQKRHLLIDCVDLKDEIIETEFVKWTNKEVYSDSLFRTGSKFKVSREVEKMSKSKYNVVNPDAICAQYGADSLRLFEMFLGPLEQAKPWKTSGISGVSSFLKKLWKLYYNGDKFEVLETKATSEELKVLHKTIKKVAEDIENFSFNTSVSTFMIAVNELTALKCNKKEILAPLLVLISPYAPHIAEELWSKLGHKKSISTAPFPVFEPKYLVESAKEYPISFNGKMRFTLELSLDLNKDEIEKAVLADERTIKQLAGKTPKKVIVVPGKIVNIVG